MTTLHEDIQTAFESRISRNPADGGGVALIDAGNELSYAELLRESAETADALSVAGIAAGSCARTALLGRDSAAYIALALGIMKAGGVIISTGADTPVREFNGLLGKTAAEIAVVEKSMAAKTAPDTAAFTMTGEIKVFDTAFAVFRRTAPASAAELAEKAGFDETEFKSLNPAFIRFSSGTTGNSKGVVLSHQTIIDRTEAANSAFELDESDTILWTLPMAHHFAATIMLFLRKGCAIDIAVNEPPETALAKLADGSVSFAYSTPYHYAEIAAAAAKKPSPVRVSDRVRFLVSTAMPLSERTAAEFEAACGRRLNQAYGIIECGLPCVDVDPGNELSLGKPTKGFKVKSDDDGEILVKGPGLFDAYLSPWRPRSEILEDDGCFRTGDLGFIDSDGKLHLTGRSNSVINFLGLKIFPEKVEAALNSHPAIRESRVFGIAHDDFGEIPVAEFTPADEAAIPDPIELTGFCSASLAAHEIPQEFTPVDSIPKTPSGKVKRRA